MKEEEKRRRKEGGEEEEERKRRGGGEEEGEGGFGSWAAFHHRFNGDKFGKMLLFSWPNVNVIFARGI